MNYLISSSTPVNVRSERMSRHSARYLAIIGAQVHAGRPLTKIPDAVIAAMFRISVGSLRAAKKQRGRAVKRLALSIRQSEAAE